MRPDEASLLCILISSSHSMRRGKLIQQLGCVGWVQPQPGRKATPPMPFPETCHTHARRRAGGGKWNGTTAGEGEGAGWQGGAASSKLRPPPIRGNQICAFPRKQCARWPSCAGHLHPSIHPSIHPSPAGGRRSLATGRSIR
jgi:hypothetical protein